MVSAFPDQWAITYSPEKSNLQALGVLNTKFELVYTVFPPAGPKSAENPVGVVAASKSHFMGNVPCAFAFRVKYPNKAMIIFFFIFF